MMGIMLEWNDGIRGILAFFPVVAISSNFSTRFLGIKGKKKKQEKQEFPARVEKVLWSLPMYLAVRNKARPHDCKTLLSLCRQHPENLFQIGLLLLER